MGSTDLSNTSGEDLSDRMQHLKPFGSENTGIDIDQLEPYRYRPLTDPERDIRLLKLCPGELGEPIRISIFHTTLEDEPKPKRPPTRMTLGEMTDKLPPGWRVLETIEGRYIFSHRDFGRTWECPVKDIDPSKYTVSDDDIPCFELQYEALSYTWGTSGGGGNIIVQEGTVDNPSFRKLRLQANLMAALPCLRQSDSSRTFWIDSICINQADDLEKGHQVHRMSVIYRGAYRVVAWVGPEDPGRGRVLDLLSFIGYQTEYTVNTFGQWGSTSTPDAVPNPLQISFPPSDDDIENIDCFFDDTVWFVRLWVVQEIRLANRRSILQLGRKTMPFSILVRAVRYLDKDVRASSVLRFGALPHTRAFCLPLYSLPFLRVISALRDKKCSDLRDKVYGALGMAPPGFAARLLPDYSLSVGEVYRDFVLSYMEHTGRLEHMEYTFPAENTIMPPVPSWVTDFSSEHHRSSCSYQQHSSGLSRCHARPDGPAALQVVGKECATVSAVAGRLRSGTGYRSRTMMRLWYAMNSSTSVPHPTGVPLDDVFAITLMIGALQERRRHSKRAFLTLEEWRELMHQMFACELDQDLLSISEDELSMMSILRSFEACSGWAYFQTREGYVGLAPPDTKEGDTLCVLLGCASPVMLRQSEPGGHFQVVGTCYVYGLEDAIGLLGPLPEPWEGNLEERVGGRRRLVFHNKRTDEYSYEDPRLGDLGDWEWIDRQPEIDDPAVFEYFRNKKTGETMNSDPRMLPEVLKARGVQLTTFVLE
ncbi:heterokaryon incompatibility protein-domain-containing protein [Echria macrotheca]|uniref:Heterokaryon incompatibility protein-domain-containing protein n=1 Tax=Echria macrotheca TaxID=438768 RepID=A0AAJ0BG34_9PEZI|nr:heterokaryon incompatibility protein-domain-containing protein [Echria macrotheca]